MCTAASVAVESWKSTPSNVTLYDIGDEPTLTVASLLRGPMLPPLMVRSRVLLIHIPPVTALTTVAPTTGVEPASTSTNGALKSRTVT